MIWKSGNPFMKKLRHLIFIFVILFLLACQAQPTAIPTETPTDPRADEAHQMILEVENAARTIQSRSDNSYHLAVEYAARDALSNFPNDPRAESWKWKMAYYAILAGDTQLGHKIYIDLIDAALNSGEVTIGSLPSWFHPGELTEADGMIPFDLGVEKIKAIGNQKKFLIKISSFPGGACFLTVQSSGRYSTSLIYDGFPENGFSAFRYDSLGCRLKDLTADGNDEVILGSYRGGHVGSSTLRVMDISVVPMQLLPFMSRGTEVVLEESGQVLKDFPVLNGKYQIQTVNYPQNCQVSLEKTFEWNEDRFELSSVQFDANVEAYAPLTECLRWSILYASWADLDDGITIMDQALELYEPVAMDGRDWEQLDEVRIEKGLLYLFADHPEEMKVAFQEVIEYPYQENGIWVKPVQNFLARYHDSSDVYAACSELTACVQDDSGACFDRNLCGRRALDHLIASQIQDVPLDELADMWRAAGVDINSTGWFDLDNDGKEELWLVVAPPGRMKDALDDLWIASDYPQTKLFHVPPVGGVEFTSAEFQIKETLTNELFVTRPAFLSFLWSRDDLTNEPNFQLSHCIELECYLWEQENKFSFPEIRHRLQNSADSYEIYVEYMNFRKEYVVDPECVTCYFDLGYIAELVGDAKTATDMYSKLIVQFPEHPLAILAKSRLGK
jgi:hypothetical protein